MYNSYPISRILLQLCFTTVKAFGYSNAGAILSDWKPAKDDAVVCDVGGGLGTLMTHVIQHYPEMKGVV